VISSERAQAPGVVEALIAHRAVRRVNFTGSTPVGRIIGELSGRHLKPSLLELGGKNPLIVLDDADLDYTTRAAAFGTFANNGQACMAANRIIVPRSVGDAFVEGLRTRAEALQAGDPRDPRTQIGPLADPARVRELLEDARNRGASVAADGTNDTTFGPSAGILTSDYDQGLAIAASLNTGMAHVNAQPVNDEPYVPFGGMGDSGYGRFGGTASIHEFAELRWTTVQRQPREFHL